MNRFERHILGYHGCEAGFGTSILNGTKHVAEWKLSQNDYDWLGRGVYFWEHSPHRALRWAENKCAETGGKPMVIGAIIQLGKCFELLDENLTSLLGESYRDLAKGYKKRGQALPANLGSDRKLRKLDCLVINDYLDRLKADGETIDTVRGANGMKLSSKAFPQ